MAFSIFMASSTSRTWCASTVSPSRTRTPETTPGMGAVMAAAALDPRWAARKAASMVGGGASRARTARPSTSMTMPSPCLDGRPVAHRGAGYRRWCRARGRRPSTDIHPPLAVDLDRQPSRSVESKATACRAAPMARSTVRPRRERTLPPPRPIGQLGIRMPAGLDGVGPRRAADDLRQPEQPARKPRLVVTPMTDVPSGLGELRERRARSRPRR